MEKRVGRQAAAFGIRHFGAQRSGSSVAVSSCAFRDKKPAARCRVIVAVY